MEKAAKKTTTNAKMTKKGDGIYKESHRQRMIWQPKQQQHHRNDEADREKAENLRKTREEEQENLRKAREQENLRELREKARKEGEEVAKLKEKRERWSRRSHFRNLMFLIEFPKGGDFWFHKYRKFLRSETRAPPCLIKGLYANRDISDQPDPNISNKMKDIYQGFDKTTSFIPLNEYDEDITKFLEFLMANMSEPSYYAYAKHDREWFIAFYWRRQWLKHGFIHGISEMDYYWKIYDLYKKTYIGDYLYYGWEADGEYYGIRDADEIMVMACNGSSLTTPNSITSPLDIQLQILEPTDIQLY